MAFLKKFNTDNLKQAFQNLKLKEKGLALFQRIVTLLKKIWAWSKQHPKKAVIAVIVIYAVYKGILFILPKDDPSKRMVQTVVSSIAEQKDFPVIIDSTGNTFASNIVDVRPQVTNVVAKIHIKEGQEVKEGDLLFTLDDRADQANFDKAKALADDANRQYKRAQELVKQNFISQAALDTSLTNYRSAVATAKAAEVALSFDRIRSPISGKAGVINVFPGTLVQPGSNVTTSTSSTSTTTIGAMVTIAQLNPMNVQFTIPEKALQGVMAEQKNGELSVDVQLPNGNKISGKVFVIDNQVDVSTGAVKVKAQIDNADGSIIPGQFVHVQLKASTIKDAIVIPSQAVISNTRGDQVYVVEAEDKVALKPVKVIAVGQGSTAVSGINAGDRIVVEGKQNLRPGGKVREAKPANKNN